MSYETAVAQIYALGHELPHTPAHKFDLAHMRVLLAALGHPENSFPSVLVAGTNGKGSTAATLASILQASGLKTGLYTSPHLVRINERIRLNGIPISDDDFVMLQSARGGRREPTNVVEPRLSIITDISLDHQKYLGETVGEIAREKVGIIRPGGIVVTLPQLPEANDAIGNTILDVGARAVNAVPYVPPVSPGSSPHLVLSTQKAGTNFLRLRYPVHVLGQEIVIESPLVGRHPLRNLALA